MSTAGNELDPKTGATLRPNYGLNSVSHPPESKPPLVSDLELVNESQTAVDDAKNTGIKFGKHFLVVFPIYVLGYFGFSFSWILILLAMVFWLRRNHGTRFPVVNKTLQFFDDEEKVVRQGLPTSKLPPWASNRFTALFVV